MPGCPPPKNLGTHVRVALGTPKETSVARRVPSWAGADGSGNSLAPKLLNLYGALFFLRVCLHLTCHKSYATVVASPKGLRCLNIALAFLRARDLAFHLWILYDVFRRGSILTRTSTKKAKYLLDDARHSKSPSVHGANLVGHLHAIVPGCV